MDALSPAVVSHPTPSLRPVSTWLLTIYALIGAMVVFGGMGTLVGAIAGAIAFLLLEDWLAQFSEHWKLWLGILLVLLVLFTKGGIAGFASRLFGGTRS